MGRSPVISRRLWLVLGRGLDVDSQPKFEYVLAVTILRPFPRPLTMHPLHRIVLEVSWRFDELRGV